MHPTPQNPKHQCDLVMKGGITSGIVYPPAVHELHEKDFTFRSIGGTSAGAIAAAGTAAAEYNGDEGFQRLKDKGAWLGADSNLRNLFQASTTTRPLLDILNAALEPEKGKSAASTTPSNTPLLLRSEEHTSE